MAQLKLGDIEVEVVHKDIKNVHLSVYPPSGKVRISAPHRMTLDTIRLFAISKLGWIKKQQGKLDQQNRETARDYISRESHFYWGKRYLLKLIEHDAPPLVQVKHRVMELYVRPNTSSEKRQQIMEEWYRRQLKEVLPQRIAAWEKKMDVTVAAWGVRKMRTCWGTCNTSARRIWINLELTKKPKHCLDYILVHEMTHLLERHHNARFTAWMDAFLPQWRIYKDDLNRFPISHTKWKY